MNYLGVYTLFKKEIIRFLHVWAQTIIGPLVSNIMFMAIFGVAMASRPSPFEGFGYLEILIPGLAAMGIMMNAIQNSMSSLMIAKYTNSITQLLVIPLRGFEMVLSFLAAATIRGVLVGTVTILAGMLFTTVHFAHPLIIVIFAVLLGGIFASVGVIIGITMPDFDKSSMIMTFVLTPMIYLGGVFFSVNSLPPGFSAAAKLNPILYLVDGFRYGFIGVGDIPIAMSLIVTSLVFALMFSIASWMFHTGYKLQT